MVNFFSILDRDTLSFEYLNFDKTENGATISLAGSKQVKIDNQQLMELGAMLIALGGNNVDFDSASELLDGFSLSVEPIKKLVETLDSVEN
jgi:threonine dehydratase